MRAIGRFSVASVVALLLLLTVRAVMARPQARDGVGSIVTGTGAIEGMVTSVDAKPVPLRRAVVTVSGGDQYVLRSAITDDEGRFSIRGLPAGVWSVAAAKPGYVAGAFGATRPGGAGTPARLVAGQTVSVTVKMFRAAVLTGVVRNERGQPLPGLRVFAIDALHPAAPPTHGEPSAVTDDRGVYRLHGLTPRQYIIAATSPANASGEIIRRTAAETDIILSRLTGRARGALPSSPAPAPVSRVTLAAVFYPGTAALSEAARVRLAPGEVRDGLDIVVKPVPVTTIQGTVVSPDGVLPTTVRLNITPASTLQFFALASASPLLVQPVGPDGRFKYSTIVPGHYIISARANRTTPVSSGGRSGGAGSAGVFADPGRGLTEDSTQTFYGVIEFDVAGQAISGLDLRLQRGATFSGRLVFDATSQSPPADLTAIRVSLQSATSDSGMTIRGTDVGGSFTSPPVAVRTDGTFDIAGVAPGIYRPKVAMPASPGGTWWFRGAVVAGRDVLDSAVNITLGTDVRDAVLTMTDRRSELSGTLQTVGGLPAPDYFVVVVPADATLRTAGSRRVKFLRPATDGSFIFSELPPGEYLLVALTDVDPDEFQTPEFLAEVAANGMRVTIAEGEHKRQDLRISAQ